MHGNAQWVQVATAGPVLQPLTYAVPVGLLGQVTVGSAVVVPLGGRRVHGWVVACLSQVDVPLSRIKPLVGLGADQPVFQPDQLRFFEWIARYYAVPLGHVIATAVPAPLAVKVLRGVHPTDEGIVALSAGLITGPPLQVLREVVSRPGLTKRGVVRKLSSEVGKKDVEAAIAQLVRRGWAAWVDRAVKGVRGKVTTAALSKPLDAILSDGTRLGARMKGVLRALSAADGPMDVDALAAEQGSGARDAVKRLVARGAVVLAEREDLDPLAGAQPIGPTEALAHNADQAAALAALTAPDAKGAHLLFGVTGSGKTEVFLGAAQHVIDQGQQVLVLVPEIGLTPQLVGRFKARFGDDVAVLHSGLTTSDRLAHWRRIRAGVARVAVGARSALFAPFQSLGLIVVDEEHDDSYKQDDRVPYHARDLAVVLGQQRGAVVVLASATPSLESWYNAEQGRYTLLTLPRRATPRPVPQVQVVDMREVERPEDGPSPVFAPASVAAMTRALADGGQVIVLYNRRGWATMVQCTSCGGAYECPNCGISMTMHQKAQVVACHYCGLRLPYTGACPSCQAETLEALGKGTERVMQCLRELFSDVAVGRMDADTTSARGAHHRILSAFRAGETRILVGTQIVAKGHDMPGVTCAVVVSADQGLRMPDFRAAERTYSLLVQVAGRAGRGDVAGTVLVQTWQPEHAVFSHLGDVSSFLAAEAKLRAVLRYPPYARLVLIRLDGVDRGQVGTAAHRLVRELRQALRGREIEFLGPSLAAMARLVGRWRFQIIVRSGSVSALRAALPRVRAGLQTVVGKGIRGHLDVDPRHLM